MERDREKEGKRQREEQKNKIKNRGGKERDRNGDTDRDRERFWEGERVREWWEVERERERENKTLQQTLSLLHGSYCHSLIRMSEAKAKCLGRVSCWDSNLHNMSNSIIQFHKVMVQPTVVILYIYTSYVRVGEHLLTLSDPQLGEPQEFIFAEAH